MAADEKTIKEVHADLSKRGVTKISYDKYRDRIDVRDKGIAKREYEERKVRMGGSR